jgi:small subunit ribosomal protein S20
VSGFNAKQINLLNIIFLEVYGLANIKSAKKRVLTSQIRADRNKAVKSRVKTYVKKVDAAVAAGDKAAAEAALPVAIGETSKGIYHKNTAARKVSRITKAVNAMA